MTVQPTTVDSLAVVVWRKSSRSTGGSNGSNCVEVGAWRKSSTSNNNGASCVETGTCPHHGIAIRDSKLPTTGDYPTLTITRTDWTALLSTVREA